MALFITKRCEKGGTLYLANIFDKHRLLSYFTRSGINLTKNNPKNRKYVRLPLTLKLQTLKQFI